MLVKQFSKREKKSSFVKTAAQDSNSGFFECVLDIQRKKAESYQAVSQEEAAIAADLHKVVALTPARKEIQDGLLEVAELEQEIAQQLASLSFGVGHESTLDLQRVHSLTVQQADLHNEIISIKRRCKRLADAITATSLKEAGRATKGRKKQRQSPTEYGIIMARRLAEAIEEKEELERRIKQVEEELAQFQEQRMVERMRDMADQYTTFYRKAAELSLRQKELMEAIEAKIRADRASTEEVTVYPSVGGERTKTASRRCTPLVRLATPLSVPTTADTNDKLMKRCPTPYPPARD